MGFLWSVLPTCGICLRSAAPTCGICLRSAAPTCGICLLSAAPTCGICLRSAAPTCGICLLSVSPTCGVCSLLFIKRAAGRCFHRGYGRQPTAAQFILEDRQPADGVETHVLIWILYRMCTKMPKAIKETICLFSNCAVYIFYGVN